jgi:hypothetical protein
MNSPVIDQFMDYPIIPRFYLVAASANRWKKSANKFVFYNKNYVTFYVA